MISGFRKSLRSWATVALLFLALVAIVVTGFGTGGGGGLGALGGGTAPTAEQVATVDGEPITADAVNNEVSKNFQLMRAQLPNADMAEFLRQGGYDGSVNALINFTAMRHYGEARGLVASQPMVDRFLANRPEFHNAVGQFDPNLFQQFLQARNTTERVLRDDVARDLMRQQLTDPVASGMRVPQGVARYYATSRLEQRRGAIGVVPIGAAEAGINPSDAEIARHYAAHRAVFAVPERRVIKFAVIGAEHVTAAAAPTGAEINAVYRNTPRYQQREARTLQSVTFTGANAQAAAQAFAQRVRGGTAFLDAARQAGYAPGDVTFANQSQAQFAGVTNAGVAAQVFSAAQGSITGPVRSPLGVHVVRVESITPSAGRPLEAVRADIVRELERRKRTAAVLALASRVEEQIGEGGGFEQVARAAGLTIVTTPPITADGRLADGRAWSVPADLRPLLAATFETDAENPEPVIAPIQENVRYALIVIDRAEPAAVPPLTEVRDRVRRSLVRQQALARARQLANGIVARINAGIPPARAFAEARRGLPPPEQINMRRFDIVGNNRQVPPPLLALFRLRPGTAEVLAAPNNAGWYVIAAQESVRGDLASAPQALAPTQQELQQRAGTELELQFIRAMRLRANVQRNEAAIAAGRAQLTGNLPPPQ